VETASELTVEETHHLFQWTGAKKKLSYIKSKFKYDTIEITAGSCVPLCDTM
jgi:hypothetical protein